MNAAKGVTAPATVSVATLTQMDHDSTLHGWATDLKAAFDVFVTANRAELMAVDALFVVVDITDFLLRVLEDDAVRQADFLSGQDDRVPYYLNLAVAATTATTTAEAINVLRPGYTTEGNTSA